MGTEEKPKRSLFHDRRIRLLAAICTCCYICYSTFLSSPAPIPPQNDAVVPASAPELYFTEWNWADIGASKVTANPGAYLVVAFEGESAVLLVDQSHTWPRSVSVAVSVDGGIATRIVLESGQASNITLAEQLPRGRHEARVTLESVELNSGLEHCYGVCRWGSAGTFPALSLRIVGVRLDDGQLLSASLRPKRMLVFGDSIAEGYGAAVQEANCTGTFFGTPTLQSMSATVAWPFRLASELNAEVSVVGWTVCGWAWPGAFGVPTFPISWELLFDGTFRSWATQPDYVVVAHGANDALNPVAEGAVEAAVRSWIPKVLQKLPQAELIIVVPFGGFRKDELQRGAAGSKAHFIDLGSAMAKGLSTWGRTPEACDGIHPYSWRHREIALALVERIQKLSPSRFLSR
eukprot:gnl/TRDRNA2_/TRDRNA2_73406_c1_seq1.p1 gnl/TRDRNA2_/TRDRNA2_73406_c1~~gnl/TRDRNA2_/TRDRNA2_73406_c1_seq1.p1  ORF type:complete len:405 (+),score=55.89 gnl/TRDRNA2_/TRDRNA2_73406_c1_seq1:83-1297(+)